ncbi:MAG: glycosyltransferase family 2 protein [Anaerolineales bacterium]|nr:glycosyltransferase family 2 protein [Anaerolineales bacterium]
MKLSIIICVFNECETIMEVLRRVQLAQLRANWEKEMIVVDNCSTDGTRELLREYHAENTRIVMQPENRGKGHSVRTAIPLCNGDFTITQDADLEYHPRQYANLLARALANDLDVVYGSRVLGGKRYHHYAVNYLAVRVLTWLTNRFFDANFTDVATNYKLVHTQLLQSLQLRCSGFDLDFEMSNQLALATDKIAEVPIDFEPRTYAQGKKIGLRDGLRAFRVIMRDWIATARGR